MESGPGLTKKAGVDRRTAGMSRPELSLQVDDDSSHRSRGLGLLAFALSLLPALAAIWMHTWVVTQDNPSHLYNSHIIARSLDSGSLFQRFYRVTWDPFPTWSAELLDLCVLAILPARLAEKAVMSLLLVGFAASIVWLRSRVAGWRGMVFAAAPGGSAGLEHGVVDGVCQLRSGILFVRDYSRAMVEKPRRAAARRDRRSGWAPRPGIFRSHRQPGAYGHRPTRAERGWLRTGPASPADPDRGQPDSLASTGLSLS